eukprot:353267-Chlamydomonas_euryale.AAC.1
MSGSRMPMPTRPSSTSGPAFLSLGKIHSGSAIPRFMDWSGEGGGGLSGQKETGNGEGKSPGREEAAEGQGGVIRPGHSGGREGNDLLRDTSSVSAWYAFVMNSAKYAVALGSGFCRCDTATGMLLLKDVKCARCAGKTAKLKPHNNSACFMRRDRLNAQHMLDGHARLPACR